MTVSLQPDCQEFASFDGTVPVARRLRFLKTAASRCFHHEHVARAAISTQEIGCRRAEIARMASTFEHGDLGAALQLRRYRGPRSNRA
jgi:hypothetical protein